MQLTIVRIYLEHFTEEAELSITGYNTTIIPRINLGKVYFKNESTEIPLMDYENTLMVKANEAKSLRFEYEYEESNEGMMLDEEITEQYLDEKIIGATALNYSKKASWDKFYLVIKYLTEEGAKVEKVLIEN